MGTSGLGQKAAQADYSAAVFVGGPNFDAGRGGHIPKYICIHGTASPSQDIDWWAARASTRGGVHYMVGRAFYKILGIDTQVIQMVREADSAWGNGFPSMAHPPAGCVPFFSGVDPNQETISIEHVKFNTDNSDSLTQAQTQATILLCEYLCTKYSIPRRWADASGGFLMHAQIDPVSRSFCPGPFPWGQLFSALSVS